MQNSFEPCWILSTQRTGSTYLIDLLNSTNLFGGKGSCDPKTDNIDRWTEYYCPHFFKEEYLVSPPIINKMHFDQYQRFFGSKDVADLLPNIRYILIKRKDLCEAAVSKYFVLEGKPFMENKERWNIHDEPSFEQMQKMNLPFEKRKLLHLYELAKHNYQAWDLYLKNKAYIEFDYQDIVDHPQQTVQLTLDYMNIKGNAKLDWDKLPKKLSHPQKDQFVKRLRAMTLI